MEAGDAPQRQVEPVQNRKQKDDEVSDEVKLSGDEVGPVVEFTRQVARSARRRTAMPARAQQGSSTQRWQTARGGAEHITRLLTPKNMPQVRDENAADPCDIDAPVLFRLTQVRRGTWVATAEDLMAFGSRTTGRSRTASRQQLLERKPPRC